MSCKLAILWTVLLSGCSQPGGLIYRTTAQGPSVSSSLALKADRLAGASGPIEPAGLLGLLLKAELVEGYPTTELASEPVFLCHPSTRLADVIRALEVRQGWVYDPSSRLFYVATATHSLDDPDEFGRVLSKDPVPLTRRPLLALSFRFQNESASATGQGGHGFTAGARLSGSGRNVEFCVPDGVKTAWHDAEDRTYFEGVRDPASAANQRQVETTLKKVSAGVQAEVLAARLPGDGFRMDGSITFASFVGAGLEQKSVTVPLQLDGPRHQWLQIFASFGSDKSADVSVNAFAATAGLGRDNVVILVRVD